MPYLKILRIPNLLIVVLTQALVYTFWLFPLQGHLEIDLALDPIHAALLMVCTLCITAGGNIINDIFDQDADLKNKFKKAIVGRQISESSARQYYWFITIVGGAIALYLAIKTSNLPWLFLYPLAVYLLWEYSKRLKCMPLSGNVLVSLLCAFVIGIIWFAERQSMAILQTSEPQLYQHLRLHLIHYMAFAASTTLFRELIKDVEDIPGDMQVGCNTLAVKFGPTLSKRLILAVGLFILGFTFLVIGGGSQNGNLLLFAPVWITTLACLFLVLRARETNHFKPISKLAKWLIVFGLLLYPLLYRVL
ncbi:MAG: UbiA family prenyltransferase [Bacteroidetes bacterium]|nr:UbiA family prenyltransferase [Bacteroidota bacterium]